MAGIPIDDLSGIKGPTEHIDLLGRACSRADIDYIKTNLPLKDGRPESQAIYFCLFMASRSAKTTVTEYLLNIYPTSHWNTVSAFYLLDGERRDCFYPDDLIEETSGQGDATTMTLYLKAGLDPNWKPTRPSIFPYSLLGSNATRPDTLAVLLSFGADPCHPGNPLAGTDSPMYLAAEGNEVESLKLLVGAGAPFGNALFAAAHNKKIDAARFLLEKGAEINEHHFFSPQDAPDFVSGPESDSEDDIDAGTALFASIMTHTSGPGPVDYDGAYYEMAEFLLSRGASLLEKDHLGKSPYDYARQCNLLWTQEQIELFNPRKHK